MERDIGWMLDGIKIPAMAWRLGSIENGSKLKMSIDVLNKATEDGVIESTCSIKMSFGETRDVENRQFIDMTIIINTLINGITIQQIKDIPRLDKEFSSYIISTVVGHARVILLRTGYEAGLQADILIPEDVKIDPALLLKTVNSSTVEVDTESVNVPDREISDSFE